MTGTACLLGLADYLEHAGTADWLARYHDPIRVQLDKMKARDVDGDGIVESTYRTGVSGTGQWSTCWFDVTSYGWKDAFSNALLYPALVRLARLFPALDAPDLADGLDDWAERLRASYTPAFYNDATGWLAGLALQGRQAARLGLPRTQRRRRLRRPPRRHARRGR